MSDPQAEEHTTNARFAEYNEPETGPQSRLLLEFGAGWAVVLLNDSDAAEAVRECVASGRLKGQFKQSELLGTPVLELPVGEICAEANDYPVSSYVLAIDGSQLVVPLKDLKDSSLVVAGLVITGKQYLKHPIKAAKMLAKDVKTPWAADKYGDSWNDHFFKEPRVIEDEPETAFTAIESIMAVAKTQFAEGNYAVAEKKYRKAFHYAHSYYPEELDAASTRKLTDLKANSLLNTVLCELRLEDFGAAIKNADYVLTIVDTTPVQQAKAYFRRGSALLAQGDEDEALRDFEASERLASDPQTRAKMRECRERRKRNIWRR